MILRAIKNLLRDWVNKSDQQDSFSNSMKIRAPTIQRSSSSIDDYNHGQNFTIFNAIGGKVVQIHYYNPQTDKSVTNLYIITDEDDFGEQLALIITRNNLSK